MLDAEQLLDAAVKTVQANGSLPETQDFSREMPRSMPFTDNLANNIFLLTSRQIDVLTTLRANLAVTASAMREITEGRRRFGLLSAQPLLHSIHHGLGLLAEAFDEFAPQRKLAFPNRDPELVTTILRRTAGATAHRSSGV